MPPLVERGMTAFAARENVSELSDLSREFAHVLGDLAETPLGVGALRVQSAGRVLAMLTEHLH